MRNVTGMLALGALALAGFSTVTALGLARDVRARDAASGASTEGLAALEGRLGALELAVMLSTTGVGGRPPALPDAGRPPSPPDAATPPGAPAGTGLAAAPKPATSLPDLERRLAELEKRLASAGPATAQTTAGPGEAPALPPEGAIRYLGSVDEAEKHLELTPAQKADLERVVADVAREREALHRLPGEDGKTWEETAKDCVKVLGEGIIQYDGEKLAAFRERQVPGRAESFGAADRRLTEEARRRIEDGLTPEQRRRLEKANVDGLVGGGGGGGGGLSFSLFTSTDVLSPATDAPPAGAK